MNTQTCVGTCMCIVYSVSVYTQKHRQFGQTHTRTQIRNGCVCSCVYTQVNVKVVETIRMHTNVCIRCVLVFAAYTIYLSKSRFDSTFAFISTSQQLVCATHSVGMQQLLYIFWDIVLQMYCGMQQLLYMQQHYHITLHNICRLCLHIFTVCESI